MPVLGFMYKFQNWLGKRDEKLLVPDHAPVDQSLDRSLNSEDDQRDFHPLKTARNSLTLRRLSMVIMRGDRESKNEECKCLTADMCPNGISDPVPCVIHGVV